MKKQKPKLNELTILDLMRAPALLGRQFAGNTWRAWRVFMAALFALPITDPEESALFRKHTGRQNSNGRQAREGWMVVGRRGGKSIIAALVAVFLAFLKDYKSVLAAGEVGTIMVIASDRRQARTIFRYVVGLIEQVPAFAAMVVNKTKDSIELANSVVIEIQTASFRATRGYTILAALCDEIGYWRSEDSAVPDFEILNSIRPGMASVPGALLLCLSSPYSRRGALWEAYREHFGKEGDPILVWQSDTASMNPVVDENIINDAYEADPIAAASEYGAEFRKDLEDFISLDALDAVTVLGRFELPCVPGVAYHAFCDPSGGSRDSMTLAISHFENQVAVLDAIREVRAPLSPEAVTKEFAGVLKSYGLHSAKGDRYGGEWPRERFAEHGVNYEVAEKTKSELYLDLLPAINSKRVELLDIKRLKAQLGGLERHTGRSGRDMIDHPPNSFDDVANSACGALVLALEGGIDGPIIQWLDRPPEHLPSWNGPAGGGEVTLAQQLDQLQDDDGGMSVGRSNDDPFSAGW